VKSFASPEVVDRIYPKEDVVKMDWEGMKFNYTLYQSIDVC
jgi:hypothetical protein